MTDHLFLHDPEDPENPETPIEPTEPIEPEEPGGGDPEEPRGGDNPEEFTSQIKDVSGMFNERGFYKANEFSFSENEIINDFNGNLIYNIPLYKYKQGGDLGIDIKLNYNGSVGHSIRTGKYSSVNETGFKNRFNINFPEWILSLNGVAVQVFNFETNYFNVPDSNSNEIEGYKINSLIPGYHYTNDNRVVRHDNPDRISLLEGDGTLITLENPAEIGILADPDNPNNYIGEYSQKGKESYIKAKVEFINPNENVHPAYKARRIILFKGDGLEYIFEEDKNDFADFVENIIDYKMRFKPLIPLLKVIRDRFGYSIHLEYNRSVPLGHGETLKGRPLLERISAKGFSSKNNESVQFSFLYAPSGIMVTHDNELNGTYLLTFQGIGVNYRDTGSHSNQIGYLREITNPLGQKIEIEYEEYRRKYSSVFIHLFGNKNINFNLLQRIKIFKSYLKLKREYKYLNETNEMDIIISNVGEDDHIISNDFKGYGRDPFFNNMITEKKEFALNNGDHKEKNKHNFSYEYVYYNTSGRVLKKKPIHENDKLKTARTIISSDVTTINNSYSKINKNLEYKIYPLFDPNNSFAYNPDKDGITKLIKEIIKDYKLIDDEEPVNTVINEFEYWKGDGNPLTGPYNGSFLMKQKKETINNIQKIWSWNYLYKDNDVDKFITQSEETGPDDMITIRKFKDYDEDITHKQFSNAYNNDLLMITSRYYIYNILQEEYKYKHSAPNTLLNRRVLTFIISPGSNDGYLGQMIKDEVFENGTSGKIVTEYNYCKNDRVGESVFQESGIYPYKEGNLREIIKPNGEVTKYFYHPTEENEVWKNTNPNIEAPQGIPHLKFFILYKNGQKIEKWEKIWDHRLPIRIDRVKRAGTNETLISRTYKEYSYDGSPIKSMDEHKLMTEFIYERVHRISKITLPGDFNTEPDEIQTYVVSTFEVEDMLIRSIAWGSCDKKSNENNKLSFSNVPRRIWKWDDNRNECMEFKTYLKSSQLKDRSAYIHFLKDHFLDIGTITKAELILRPLSYEQSFEGDNLINRKIALKMVYSINRLNPKCGQASEPGDEFFYHHDNSPGSIVFDLNIPDDQYCHYSNEVILNITNRLNSFFQTYGNPANVGFLIEPFFFEIPEPPNSNNGDEELNDSFQPYAYLKLLCENTSDTTWTAFSPRILLTAQYSITNTRPIFKSGTINYTYDDDNFIVNVYSIRKLPDDKSRIRHYLDSYGNVKKKDIHVKVENNIDVFNSFISQFNFLNLPAISTDAAGNMTRLSYDGLQRLIKTQNADGSFNTTSYTYQNSLGSYFEGTYTGFIEKQIFTDENENTFEKYFDAFGNLRREVKYISQEPVDPETPDVPPIKLETDYKYDDLYRLIIVKTPQGKLIEYLYDGYGRQIQRQTPDTGIVVFKYDSNNNLIYSQDANQRAAGGSQPGKIFTFRKYDAINRLTVLGENSNHVYQVDTLDPDEETDFSGGDNPNDPYFDYLVVNVYDNLNTAAAAIFSPPSDYQPTQQNNFYYTKGRLVATAFRTRKTDPWNFKYYMYDERGRVKKMLVLIDGLDVKRIEYKFNSQDQITNLTVLVGDSEMKMFRYRYDIPGRLSFLDIPDNPAMENPLYFNLTRYLYNANSLIEESRLNAEQIINSYDYTPRNWILSCYDNLGIFNYNMDYFPNGNVHSLLLQGNYNDNFEDNGNILSFQFSYDKSNRLLNAISNYEDEGHNLKNTYDKDGNILTLKRYGYTGSIIDDFNYSYYPNSNKLKKVSNEFVDFNYDLNGNLVHDDMNKNIEINYDHRNLITNMKHWSYWSEGQIITSRIYYYYDEAGNRVRKLELRTYFPRPEDPSVEDLAEFPIYNEEDFESAANDYFNTEQPTGGPGEPGDNPVIWYIVQNEFYIRGVEGNELVIFNSNEVSKYNFYGSGNEGYIDAEDKKHYYLKDHLGSVRVVLNEDNEIVSAQDYDMWGYLMAGRSFEANISKYKFTGKERDKESNYDYFNARNFNPRIGRFLSCEPVPSSSFGWSDYVYCANNPLRIIDPSGKEWYFITDENGKGKWEYHKDSYKEIWTGDYDKNGNKIYKNVQGYKEILYFSGDELQWLQESGEIKSWKAVSGILDSEGRTQPDTQAVKDAGPIPEGWYTVDPRDTKSLEREKNPLQIPNWFAKSKSWGFAYTAIKPAGDTNTHGRGSFFIHGGSEPGSIGCIDITGSNEVFHRNLVKNEKVLMLHVNYSNLKK